ncbi:MAG: UDP-N-acetylmuramyl-tripeptide synthetase [Candidatus Pacebacteria bacterium]|nr:UDP-N-acetylmuramyl-tripeptide synthetase [Candidatus Paceibacterota bacterium]
MIKKLVYQLKRPYHLLKTGLLRGLPAQLKYSFPNNKLKIIAITGTDGKTTSSTLLYQVLKTAGKKVALISTVACYLGSEEVDTGLHVTSPDPKFLYYWLDQMVKKNIEYLVLEATSHGIYQYRTWGIEPVIAGLTNITHEHLDYHQDYQQYLQAKTLLLAKAQTAIINHDDQSFTQVKKLLNNANTKIISYSQDDQLARSLKTAINKRFPESYNQMNARLVAKIAKQLQLKPKQIAQGIKKFTGVPGRMQFVPNKRGFKAVVDFAHTPNALKRALLALQQQLKAQKTTGRLIAVFGCAGLRDWQKRPLMGKIGAKLADLAIFTAEDPRTEDVWSIIRQMKQDLTTEHAKVISIADRAQAIDFAINKLAKKGDWIGVFGKGPEKSLCYGQVEQPWSDVQVVKKALANQ